MPKTIGVERTVEKWKARAGVAGADYEAGIRAPKRPWEEATLAAKTTFATAIKGADVPELFARGVRRAGNARWAEMAAKKGIGRFSEGVGLADPYFRSQMTDVLGQIEGVRLSPRGPRGSAANYGRVKEIGDKLHAWRLAKRAAAGA